MTVTGWYNVKCTGDALLAEAAVPPVAYYGRQKETSDQKPENLANNLCGATARFDQLWDTTRPCCASSH